MDEFPLLCEGSSKNSSPTCKTNNLQQLRINPPKLLNTLPTFCGDFKPGMTFVVGDLLSVETFQETGSISLIAIVNGLMAWNNELIRWLDKTVNDIIRDLGRSRMTPLGIS